MLRPSRRPADRRGAGRAIHAGKTAHIVAREFGHAEVFDVLMARTPDELKLAVACELGDEEPSRALLARHPNLRESFTDFERGKLADAARDNNDQAVRLMLGAGWPADAPGQHGATALHWTAFHGNAALAGDLLRHQAPLEIADKDYGGTPLSWAVHGSVHGWHCKDGDYGATVELLLKAGAAPPQITDHLEASDAVHDVLRRWRG